MRRPPFLLPLLLLPALGGCTLIDQTTFFGEPAAKPVAVAPTPEVDPRKPLLVIGATTPAAEYGDALHTVIRVAETRKRDLVYDVVAIVPTDGSAGAATLAANDAGARAGDIMRAIMAQGVPAARIRIAMRPQTGPAAREIRVYVR